MAGAGSSLATAFVRIQADLSDFQTQVESGTAEVGDTVATGIQEGVSKGGESLGALSEKVAAVGATAGAELGDGIATGVAAGVAKSAASLDALAADGAAAADKVAVAGSAASDKMAGGFLSGGMGKLLGGGIFAALGTALVVHVASAAEQTAKQLAITKDMLGLTSLQTEKLMVEANAAGLSLSTMDKMAARLDKSLGTATNATGAQAKALTGLGVSAQTFASANLPERADLLAVALSKSNLPAKTLDAYLKSFNINPKALTSAKTLNDVLAVTSAGLVEGVATGSAFGRTLAQNGINIQKFAAEKFPDQLNTIANAFDNAKSKGQATQLVVAAFGRTGTQLIPLIENMSTVSKLADELHLPVLNTQNIEKSSLEFKEVKSAAELWGEYLVTKLVPAITATVGAVIGFVGPIVKAVANSQQLKKAIDDIASAAQSVVSDIEKVTSDVTDFVSKSSTAQTVLETLAGAVGGVAAAFVVWTAATAAWEAITEAATAVQAAFNAVMDANPIALVVIAIAALVGALVVLYEKVPAVRDVINDAFADIQKVVGDAVSYLESLWAEWGSTITADANTVWNGIKTVISSAINVVSEVISTTISVVEALWSRWGSTIMSVVSTAWNMVKTIVTTDINVIKDVIEAIIDVIEGKWGDAWGKIEDAVGAALSGTWTLIKDSLSIASTVMETLGKAALDGIVTGLKDLATLVWAALKKGFEAVVAGDQWLVIEAEKIGEDLIHGIEHGITGLAGELEKTAVSTVTGALGGLASAFGIKSPSTVTRDQIGVPLGEGIVEGIDKALGSGAGGALGKKLVSKVKDATDAAKESLQTSFAGLDAKVKELGPALGEAGAQAMQKLRDAVANAVTTTDVTNLHAAIGKLGSTVTTDLATVKKQIADAKVFDGLKTDADKLGSDITPEIAADMKKIQDEMSTVVTIQGQAKVAEQVTALKTLITNQLDKIKTAISNEQSSFSTAFQELVSPIDSDFEAATAKAIQNMQVTVQGAFQSFSYGGSAGIVTPAQAALNTLQEAHDAAQQQAQLASDQAQLAIDQAAGDAATILSDQQAVAEDQYQIQVSALTKQADLENTAADTQLTAAQNSYQDQRNALETAMNQRLTDIETGLSNGNISAQQGMSDLDGILTDPQYGIDANQSAYALGGQVYTGLNAGLQPVFDLVTQLQTNLAKIGQLQASVTSGVGGSNGPAISTSTLSPTNFASENGDTGALESALNNTVVPAVNALSDTVKKTAAATTVTINSTTSHAAQTARDALR